MSLIPKLLALRASNFKSIADCNLELNDLTVLVGKNGSGKSNLLDALSFVEDCLSESVEHALGSRGGLAAVRRQSSGRPHDVTIGVKVQLNDRHTADYEFRIGSKAPERFFIKYEKCTINSVWAGEAPLEYSVQDGVFQAPIQGIAPKINPDRLMLYAASSLTGFRPLYDFLTSMRFYSLAPDRLRELQKADRGEFLRRDGGNAAAVLKRLKESNGAGPYARLIGLMAAAVPGLESVDCERHQGNEYLRFQQASYGEKAWSFDAQNMSDGTLRMLGLFLAVLQEGWHSLIAIEEPEATVHPAMAEALMEFFLKASGERQIIITTHSPDILDTKGLGADQIRTVEFIKGRTVVGEISAAARNAIHEGLYTPGELLRVDELGSEPVPTGVDIGQPDFPFPGGQ